MARNWILGLSALWLVGFLAAKGMTAERLRFATHFVTNPANTLPSLAAYEKGFWQQEGLKVEWVPFRSTAAMHQAVAAGSVDMGTTGTDTLIASAAAGIPEIMVADAGASRSHYFWVLTDSRLKQPKDLKGATVGLTRFGQATHYLTIAVLKALGLEGQVKLVALGESRTVFAALKTRKIDATVLSEFSLLPLTAEGEARYIIRVDDYLPPGLTSTHTSIFSARDFANKNPEDVRKAIKGFFRGAVFVMENRDWAIEKMKTEIRYTEKAAKLAYPMLEYSRDGKIDKVNIEQKLRATIKFLVDNGIVASEKIPPLNMLYTDRFLR